MAEHANKKTASKRPVRICYNDWKIEILNRVYHKFLLPRGTDRFSYVLKVLELRALYSIRASVRQGSFPEARNNSEKDHREIRHLVAVHVHKRDHQYSLRDHQYRMQGWESVC